MLSAVLFVLVQSAEPPVEAEKLVALADRSAKSQAKSAQWVMRRKGKWLKMKNDSAHLDRQGMWDGNVDLVANVVGSKKDFILVTITAGSPSGDLVDLTTSYFWPQGNLACIQFNSARIDYGGQQLIRWFDRTGKQVARVEVATDGNGEVTSDPAAVKISKEFGLGGRPYAAAYSKLPFAKLITIK